MRKTIGILLALTALAFAGNAFAAEDTFQVMVTDRPYDGGTIADYNNRNGDVFQLSETPYLFMHIPTDASSLKWSFWKPEGASQILSQLGPNTMKDLTLTIDWSGLKVAGQEWTVKGMYSVPGYCEDKTVKFSFAPEPLSAGLFLLGGAALAVSRRKKGAA